MKSRATTEKPATATRDRYSWHLLPPCAGKFDFSHWWEADSEAEPAAAIYELARRHPVVGTRMAEPWKLKNPLPVIVVLGDIGLKPWPKLTVGKQSLWKKYAGNLKGLDCRDEWEKCCNLAEPALRDLERERAEHGGKAPRLVVVHRKGRPDRVSPTDGPTADEWESAVARVAAAASRKGYVLVSVAPDLEVEEAVRLFETIYRAHRRDSQWLQGTGKQRARPDNWLDLIATFEKDFNSKSGVKAETFKRYKRAMDGFDFAAGR